jgi:hypothetical protein
MKRNINCLAIVFLMLIAAPGAFADPIQAVTSLAALNANESGTFPANVLSGYAGDVYTSNYSVANQTGDFIFTSNGAGNAFGYSERSYVQTDSSGQNGTWYGDFSPGESVYQGLPGIEDNNNINFTFNPNANDPGVYGIGFQLNVGALVSPGSSSIDSYAVYMFIPGDGGVCFYTDIVAYNHDCNAPDAGGFTSVQITPGTSGDTADGSAPFIGIVSDELNPQVYVVALTDSFSGPVYGIGTLYTTDEPYSGTTPEPGTLLLMGSGLLGVGRLIRRKTAKA